MFFISGMGYSLIANVPPVHGIYSSFFPALMYTLLGTSRHSAVGPFAIVSGVMTGNIVIAVQEQLKNEDLIEKFTNIDIAIVLSFTIGVYLFLAALFRLDFISNYLSEQLISGFSTSASIYVFTSQLKYLLGLDLKSHSGILAMLRTWYDAFSQIHKANFVTIGISCICLVILLFFKLYVNEKLKKFGIKTPFPIDLLVVIGGTVASHFLQLSKNYDVHTVGHIQRGYDLFAKEILNLNYILNFCLVFQTLKCQN